VTQPGLTRYVGWSGGESGWGGGQLAGPILGHMGGRGEKAGEEWAGFGEAEGNWLATIFFIKGLLYFANFFPKCKLI
jgi:hypothetical protein